MTRAPLIPAAALALLPGVAAAEDFLAPEGCTAFLTVQSRGCVVSIHYSCEANPGAQFRVDFDEEGSYYTGQIDAEAQWVTSTALPSGQTTRTVFPAPDPASLTTLFASGYDDWTFEEIWPDGTRVRVEGEDRLTGATVRIDGETLHATTYRYRMTDMTGRVLNEADGAEYVSQRFRRFFSGLRTIETDGVSVTTDRTPVDFIHPGEAGFLSTTPLHDCGPMMSGLPTPEGRA